VSIGASPMTDITTSSITCAGGLPAFVAAPADASRKVPVIVVLHERYGYVEAHFADLTRRFAREGYVAIAPDLFYKHPDQDALHRGEVVYRMTDPESVVYMNAALDALKELPQADLSRIAVMGVCQTGRHPIVLAAARPISAALVWYGAGQPKEFEATERYPVALEDLMARLDCPVLGHFGEADHLISIDHVRRFRAGLERHGKTFKIRIYRDAPHGWLNNAMPGRYREDTAEQALADQSVFLREVMSPDYDRSRVVQRYSADISADYDFSKNVRQA